MYRSILDNPFFNIKTLEKDNPFFLILKLYKYLLCFLLYFFLRIDEMTMIIENLHIKIERQSSNRNYVVRFTNYVVHITIFNIKVFNCFEWALMEYIFGKV